MVTGARVGGRAVRHRVTIGDLAAELGLSQSSVSSALNGGPGVSEATRTRVRELADAWGWRPHAGARALRLRRSLAVGLALARDPEQLSNEPFYSLVVGGIEQELHSADYSLLLRMVGRGGDERSIYRRWHEERNVDGVIMFDAVNDDPRVNLVAELGMPAVVVGEFEPGSGLVNVCGDVEREVALLLGHLASLGHRHVLHVGGPTGLRHEGRRVTVLDRQSQDLGLHVSHAESNYSVESAREVVVRTLCASPGVTAVLASSDLIGLGAYRAAEELGLDLPRDLSLLSWDDSLTGRMLTPSITALDRDPLGLGRAAAAALLVELGAPPGPAPAVTPPPSLQLRATTGPASLGRR